MDRQPIPLTRSVYLHAYTSMLSELGAPLEQDLGKFKLPLLANDERDLYIPLIPAVGFLQFAMLRDGIDDIGLRASQRLEFYNLTHAILTSVCHHSTLNTVLQAICRLARLEDNCLRVWMVRHGTTVRLCSKLLGLEDEPHLEHSQWIQNMMLVCIVRHFAGQKWVPKTMAFESHLVPGTYAREQLPSTLFLTGRPSSWIEVPLHLLGSTRNGNGRLAEEAPDATPRPALPAEAVDFIGSLKAALFAYVGTGCPPIQDAADLAGMSIRRLQRELAAADLSYSGLTQQVRVEEAMRLLHDSDAKIVDIAYAVGYSAPPHFTRAFSRITGMTPRQFRRTA